VGQLAGLQAGGHGACESEAGQFSGGTRRQ